MLVHHKATPTIKFAGTHLYTYRWRKALREECHARKNNTMSPLGLKPGPFDTEMSALTIRPHSSPTVHHLSSAKLFFLVWNFVQSLKLHYQNKFCQSLQIT